MWQHNTFSVVCYEKELEGFWFNYESWFSSAEDVGPFFWQPLPNPPERQ